jgi:hypothetical protein
VLIHENVIGFDESMLLEALASRYTVFTIRALSFVLKKQLHVMEVVWLVPCAS